MAAPRDIPNQRLSSHHASSVAPAATSMPGRHSSSRHHAHSVSLGTFNPDHRVTRRKSVNTSSVSNVGALRAALNGSEETTTRTTHRRSLPAKSASGSRAQDHTFEAKSDNPPTQGGDESAIADELGPGQPAGASTKARSRRASEGSHLAGKRASGELKCEKCGKGYKHSSCLTKHLWEHTPEWALTSKLLISKHQQVQLLEAASVLVGMNLDSAAESDALKPMESENSSASPAASGSSGLPDDDDYSSAETTPPPMSEHYGSPVNINTARSKRYSGNSSSFSRSYQSAPSSSLPNNNGFASTGGFGSADEEEASLVAAVQSLCSFGTPRNGPVLLPADVPPVPPLPARFAEKSVQNLGMSTGKQDALGTVSVREVGDRDTEMEDRHAEEFNHTTPPPISKVEDYDDGVFGGMEGLSHEVHDNISYTRSS